MAKKCKTKKMSLGGDLLKTALNISGSPYGFNTYGVENETLSNISDVGGQVFDGVTDIAASVVPGLGQLLSAGKTASGFLRDNLSNDTVENTNPTSRQLNIDPRYLNFEMGGDLRIAKNGKTKKTDTIPTDDMGNPSQISGRNPIAFTDGGEVIWNDYVFSDKLGYSKKANDILKKYELRLGKDFSKNDKLAKEQLNRDMSDLADEQDKYKEDNWSDENEFMEFKRGGDISINPSRVGSFSNAAKRRGMGVQQFANRVMANKDKYSSSMVKKANFAKNAAQWNKKEFGDYLEPKSPVGVTTPGELDFNQRTSSFLDLTPRSETSYLPNYINYLQNKKPTYSSSSNLDNILPSVVGQAGSLIGRAAIINKLRKDSENITPSERYIPEEYDFSRSRLNLSRERDRLLSSLRRSTRGNPNASIAAATALNESVGSQLAESLEQEQNLNIQERSKAQQFNIGQSVRDRDVYDQNKAAYYAQLMNLFQDVGTYTTGVTQDLNRIDLENQLLAGMETPNFNIEGLFPSFKKGLD